MRETYQSIATRELPRGRALDLWMNFGSETLGDMVVDPDDRATFDARLTRVTVGGLGVVWMETSAATARRRSPELGKWGPLAGGAFLLVVQESGESRLAHGGSNGSLMPGDMVLRDARRAWQTRSCGTMRTVTLKIPTPLLLTRIGDPERLVGHVMAGRTGPARMASSIILSIKRSLAEAPQEEWSEAVGDVVLDALALACGERSGHDALSGPAEAALWRKARLFIDRRLDDPDLKVGAVADDLGISLRSLQRLFVQSGDTASRYILHRRLARAAEMLKEQDYVDRNSITDIAYAVGFNELSYFCRAFAQRYGMTPRRFRERGGR